MYCVLYVIETKPIGVKCTSLGRFRVFLPRLTRFCSPSGHVADQALLLRAAYTQSAARRHVMKVICNKHHEIPFECHTVLNVFCSGMVEVEAAKSLYLHHPRALSCSYF